MGRTPVSLLFRASRLLLTPQVTSALWPLHCSVHPLLSAAGDPSTTVSQLLLGLSRPLPVAAVAAALGAVVERAYEVIRIRVQGGQWTDGDHWVDTGSQPSGRGSPHC